jgi:hypothetical protein
MEGSTRTGPRENILTHALWHFIELQAFSFFVLCFLNYLSGAGAHL